MVDVNGVTQSSVVGKVMVCLRQSVDKQPANVICDFVSGGSFGQTQTHCVQPVRIAGLVLMPQVWNRLQIQDGVLNLGRGLDLNIYPRQPGSQKEPTTHHLHHGRQEEGTRGFRQCLQHG